MASTSRRLPPLLGSRPARDHHLRRDARFFPAADGRTRRALRARSSWRAHASAHLRPAAARHLAAGVRLHAGRRSGCCANPASGTSSRHARRAVRRPAPALRRLRADLHARQARPRSARDHESSASRSGARRKAIPATPATASSTATSASTCIEPHMPHLHHAGIRDLHRHQVPPDHRPDRQERAVPPRLGARARGRARRALHVQPREAGRAGCRAPWTARRSSSRPTTPSCSATGGSRGPDWINFLLRKIAYDQGDVKTITPSEYLDRFGDLQPVTPPACELGHGRYCEVWLDGTNDWIYPPPARRRRTA